MSVWDNPHPVPTKLSTRPHIPTGRIPTGTVIILYKAQLQHAHRQFVMLVPALEPVQFRMLMQHRRLRWYMPGSLRSLRRLTQVEV